MPVDAAREAFRAGLLRLREQAEAPRVSELLRGRKPADLDAAERRFLTRRLRAAADEQP
jgi:hypothetical protein